MDNTLYMSTYILYSLFELYILYKLMNLFLGKPNCEKRYVILAYGLRFLICTVQYCYFPYVWLNPIVGVAMLLAVTFCYGKNIQKKIVSVVISFMCIIAAETVVAAVYGICNIGIAVEGYNGDEYTYICMAVVLGIIYKLITCFKNVDNEVMIPNGFNIIIIMVSLMIFLLITIIFLQDGMSKSVKVISAICLLLIVFLLMYLYDLMVKNCIERIQSELIVKEKKYYYKQIELMKENGERLSNFRHDINNHLYVIQELIGDDKVSAKKYISSLINGVEDTKSYSSTGNIAIDSVINYKMSKAEEYGINVNVDITLPPSIGNDTEDIVAMLGNILDNAIEANRNVKKEKYVAVNIRHKSGMTFIRVINSYDGNINTENGQINTRKNDKELHGIGLKSVKFVVDKYDGTMDIKYDDNQFCIDIVLYS